MQQKVLTNLNQVIEILKKYDYNILKTLSGYLITGDISYLPSFENCRNKMLKFDRNVILEVLIKESLIK